MRVGIDGRMLTSRRTGIGNYTFEIIKVLASSFTRDIQFYVYSNDEIILPSDLCEGWILRIDRNPYTSRLKSTLWLKLVCGFFCKKDNLDVFLAFGTFYPFLSRSVYRISFVYDFTYLLHPHTMGKFHRISFRTFFLRDIKSSNFVVSISNGTAEKLLTFSNRRNDLVVYPGVSNVFRELDPKELSMFSSGMPQRDKFILTVGTLEPRKNLGFLIHVFSKMKTEGFLSGFRLKVVGMKGWGGDKYLSGTGVEDVELLGYVEESELLTLYNTCSVFIFPSLYEGFGMPVSEARACGARVIATDIIELREAGDDSVIYTDLNYTSMKESIIYALNDEKILPNFEGKRWENNAHEFVSHLLKMKDGIYLG